MDLHEPSVFDNVMFEKSKAIARFNRFRKITKILQVLEVLMALILISWSSTKLPTAVRLSGNFLFELAGYVFNPHVVFLIGNVIIVALFVLCRENGAGSMNSVSGDIYDDYVRHSQAQQPKVSVSDSDNKTSSAPPSETKEPTNASAVAVDGDDETKQIVCVHSEGKSDQCAAAATAIEDATKQIQRFQRTQSAKLKRDISTVKLKGELRRSETVTERHGIHDKQVVNTSSFDTMDNLSIEEFNLTVDNFIRKMKTPEFLKMQKLDENEELKNLTKITRNSTVVQY